MRGVNWERFQSLMINATLETLYMVALAALFTLIIGLPIGVLLFLTRQNGLWPQRSLAALLNGVVNLGRALPFVILLIALIPFTRLIVGTSLGSSAAVVPITLGAFPFFARIVESALDEVDRGRIEAVASMGATLWQIVSRVLLPEALPALVAGMTLTIVMLIGFSAMAGVVGGGGLGDLAIRYGYQRFDNNLMAGTVVVLLLLVMLVQKLGDRLVRALAHRR
ncbi:metal ABC transporter permease [Erwinia sp. OLTSP20]|uniref:methionine ABC transporter permease n=1 Tax=unclassified Erwinia TaxID=2622719 RepID=UPI000C182355|nr:MULTISPECIES: methionine ABC transporter permease [unclassified Erwinia]PIJ50199.1 metal ABC transporter permease [Erwinia sp. OAMSP11]PIJ72036.1 metal ABC transporter permease [Erwinia sp. OLSSP12]PIJ81327.1 metal ABC transporter permease [Erwinia sp. OLCASP19]PIJ84033.1 metal ABC transporter permease [Erwinia sp. OLMTSP26]PIJ85732.1 metal ABC transporter permease [Erwinia sp. OLMDSP33]